MQNRGMRVALAALLVLVGTGAAMAAASDGKAGEPRQRLIRSWPEDVQYQGRSVPGRVQIWFDYTNRVVIQRVVVNAKEPGGAYTIIKSETLPPGMGAPTPSEEEIAEAMEIVRQDKEIANLISATHAVLDGGFQIFERAGKPCGPGSRCLKVQLDTQDRLGLIRNVIVDLTTQSIAYRSYLPAEEGAGK